MVVEPALCVCVCVCVSQWIKVPDEWQAWQAILQVSSSKHNAKKLQQEYVCVCTGVRARARVCVCVCTLFFRCLFEMLALISETEKNV